jgi:cholesterol transport system auxiliary component
MMGVAVRLERAIFVGFVTLTIAACTGGLLETKLPVPVSYVIASLPAGAVNAGTPTEVDISVGRPDVAPGLDTDRIAVLKGRQLDYYRAARWGGSTTETMQAFLVSSLQDQQIFRSVTPEQARVAGDYVLDVEVRHFQAEYSGSGAPRVHVMFIGRLIRVVDRQLVGTLPTEAHADAGEERLGSVVQAFETAAQLATKDLAGKLAELVASDAVDLRRARGENEP